MIKCKICGYEVKYRLIDHIQKFHKMDIEYYKKEYGEVISEEYKNICSERSREKWKDVEYREKVVKSREYIYTDKDIQEKRIKSIKVYYENGGKVWNDGLKKDDDDRLKSIGQKNKINLTGRTKETHEYLKKHSDLMKSRWENSEILKKWQEIQNNEELKNEWKNKISETITERVLNGELNIFNNFNCGWYENRVDKYWYASFLEKESMILFDKNNIIWTTKHKIKIEYYINDERHYYIPDFLIKIKNENYIIEMKGFDWDGYTELKKEYTIKKYKNYFIFSNIDELEKFINLKNN